MHLRKIDKIKIAAYFTIGALFFRSCLAYGNFNNDTIVPPGPQDHSGGVVGWERDSIQKKPIEQMPQAISGEFIVKLKPGKSANTLRELNSKYKVLSCQPLQSKSPDPKKILQDLKNKHKSLAAKHQSWYWQLDKNSKEYKEYMARLEAEKKQLDAQIQSQINLVARLAHRQRRASQALNKMPEGELYLIRTDGKIEGPTILNAYSSCLGVEYIEPNYQVDLQGVEMNDPYYLSSGSWKQSYDDLWGLKRIRAPETWEITQGEGIIVAVIDTGVDYRHPDLSEDTNGNGKLDKSEDINGNGVLDPGEDLDGDSVLDFSEDWNNNGKLDPNEDVNENGAIDPGEDKNNNGHLDRGEDGNGNGMIDSEDQNANDILDSNIWINTGEIPANGIDDDRNGYIDDVWGWDFTGRDGLNLRGRPDNDPMDGHGHGTHVAGTIAAVGNNGIGIVGVAPKAKIMSLKIFDNSGKYAGMSAVLDAISYAINNGADVINASWGGVYVSKALQEKVTEAIAHGVVFVAAAGNSSIDAGLFEPASIPGVIDVGSSTHQNLLSPFSNLMYRLDVVAPGGSTHWDAATDPNSSVGVNAFGLANQWPFIVPKYKEVSLEQKVMLYLHKGPWGGTLMVDRWDNGFKEKLITEEIGSTYSEVPQYQVPFEVRTKYAGEQKLIYLKENSSDKKLILDTLEQVGNSKYTPHRRSLLWDCLFNNDRSGMDILSLFGYGTQMGYFRPNKEWYCRVWGTSMASPHVAGVVALILSRHNQLGTRLTVDSVRQILRSSADDINADQIGGEGWDMEFGYGLVNAFKAVSMEHVGLSKLSGVDHFAHIKGVYDIRGAAGGDDFSSYKLNYRRFDVATNAKDIFEPWLPENIQYGQWETIPVSPGAKNEGEILGQWDTRSLPEGIYQVQLTVEGTSGKQYFDNRLVYVIQMIKDGWPYNTDLFDSTPCTVADLDGDGNQEIIRGGNSGTVRCLQILNRDGTRFASYPEELDEKVYKKIWLFSEKYPPLICDLDNDGDKEIVLVTANNQMPNFNIWALHHDGTLVSGWQGIYSDSALSGYPSAGAVNAFASADDINNDGRQEVFSLGYNTVFGFSYSGAALGGWPKTLNEELLGMAIGDVAGDAAKEVVVNTRNRIYIYEAGGALCGNAPLVISALAANEKIANLCLADFDKDGKGEIVFSAGQKLFVVGANGNFLRGFPVTSDPPTAITTIAIADLDKDGYPDLIVGPRLGAFNRLGVGLPGWSINTEGGIIGGISVADVNGDASKELMFFDSLGRVCVYDFSGKLLARLPEYTPEASLPETSSPLICDLEKDKKAEIISMFQAPGKYLYQGRLYAWSLDRPYDDSSADWPMLRHDCQLTSNYDFREFFVGDLSKNGKVTSYDAALASKIALRGNPTADELKRGDVNEDNKIDAVDAVLISKKAVELA